MRWDALWKPFSSPSKLGASDGLPNSSNGSTNSDGDPSQSLDEASKLQLGLGALRAMENLAVDVAQDRAAKAFQDGNLQLWRSGLSRLGLTGGATGQGDSPPGDDGVQQSVRIDSPDQHHHYHPKPVLGPLAAGLLGGVITAGLAAGGYWLAKNPPPAVGTPPATQPDQGPEQTQPPPAVVPADKPDRNWEWRLLPPEKASD